MPKPCLFRMGEPTIGLESILATDLPAIGPNRGVGRNYRCVLLARYNGLQTSLDEENYASDG